MQRTTSADRWPNTQLVLAFMEESRGEAPTAVHFSRDRQPKRRIAPKAAERFKQRIRELTSQTRGIGIRLIANELSQYLRGWLDYFGQCQTPSLLEDFDKWIRRWLRSMIWKQWKRYWTRYRQLRKRGVERRLAINTAQSNHGPWRLAKSPA
jgi:RNA-directed DNA polymerase